MRILFFLLIGLGVGGVSGLLGIGGGVLLLPLLVWLYGPEHQARAAGTTLAVLVVPVVLPALWRYYAQNMITAEDLKAAACIAAAFAVGGYVGASAVPAVPLAALRFGFGLMLMYVAARFILASDSEAANVAFALAAVAATWVGYHGLRLLGRRHPPRPDLDEATRELGRGWSDYSI
jgi:uncharacterized membrane protein YfcA